MQKNTMQLHCVFLLTVIHTPQPFGQLLYLRGALLGIYVS